MDVSQLKETWGQVTKSGDDVPHFFYSHLFLSHPELRELFPISMTSQRDKLVGALGRIVSHVDELPEVTGFIQQLGRDHRRFSVVADNYQAVGASLLATLQHFLGASWTPEVADDWAAAYGVIASVMVQAAEESEDTTPAWWDAEVLGVERRTLDVAVVQARPVEPFEYRPGQSVAVEFPQRPRLWRYYSPANAPREDGSLELHVQLVPGGQVSGSVARALRPGQVLRVGAPVGERLVLPDVPDGDVRPDLLLVAGGTGLSPLRAVLEQVDAERRAGGHVPQVHLFHGARVPWNLYERPLLTRLARQPWFTYTEVVSHDDSFHGATGLVGTAAAEAGPWDGYTAMVCGSAGMVDQAVEALADAGVPRDEIHYEHFAAAGAGPTHDHSREAGATQVRTP